MSYTSPTVTYTTTIAQKIQSRKAALKLRNGSPKLQELLRKKCRIHVKEQRFNFINKMRMITEEDKKHFLSIIREGISEMEEDLELQELIFKEIQQEAEQWMIEEFEKEENYLIQQSEAGTEVFCPLCQKCILQKVHNCLSCNCGLRLLYPDTLTTFYAVLQGRIQEHENFCGHQLLFFTEPKPIQNVFSLHAMCTTCDYLTKIVD